MAVNKVEYGDTTLIDLTSDTVTKETLLIGATAHTASGESISGEFDTEIYLRKSGGDTTNNIVTFTSGDSPSPTAWTDVDSLVTGEKHSSLLNKISTMIKNVRFLYKVLGTTDISTIGDGTVTGAVSTLNSSLTNLFVKREFIFSTNVANGDFAIKIPIDIISGYTAFLIESWYCNWRSFSFSGMLIHSDYVEILGNNPNNMELDTSFLINVIYIKTIT